MAVAAPHAAAAATAAAAANAAASASSRKKVLNSENLQHMQLHVQIATACTDSVQSAVHIQPGRASVQLVSAKNNVWQSSIYSLMNSFDRYRPPTDSYTRTLQTNIPPSRNWKSARENWGNCAILDQFLYNPYSLTTKPCH